METMNRSSLLALHDYGVYANNLVLDTAANMSEEELTRPVSPSHGSAKALLLHLVMCEYGFLVRCTGSPIEGSPDDVESLDINGIRALFDTVSALRKDYLDSVSEEAFAEVIEIQLMQKPFRLARWQMLAQSLIHSVHHRGELSIVMTGLGHPLPTLDPILKFIHDSGQVWE